MQAVVLVGGQGTRLRPLTLTTPKPLVPLGNRPVIEQIVRWLDRNDIDEVLLATQYQAGAFAGWLRHWRGMPVRAIEEPEPRGTAGAVANVAPYVRGTTVVVNGDNLMDLDLRAMLAAHRAARAVATISTDAVDDPTGRGVVVSDAEGRVHEFHEKPAPGAARARTVNTGVYLLEPEAIATIPRDRFCNFEQDVFPALIASGARVQAFQSRHTWIDTGTPAGYRRALAAVLHESAGATPAGDKIGGIWREDAVTIDGNATIQPPAAVGFGTMIAAGVQLAASSVGRECHVLADAVITNSAVWDNCQIERGSHVCDSLIGNGCYIGVGARVDQAILGDGCIIRASAILQPGTTLLPHTTYPGSSQDAANE